MDPDVLFVLGCIICVLAVPAVISAFADGRAPRAPALIILIAGGMITYAIIERPGNYSLETMPDVFARVISQVLK